MNIFSRNLEFFFLNKEIEREWNSTRTRRRVLRAGAEREKSEKSSLTSSTSFLFNILNEEEDDDDDKYGATPSIVCESLD
jgi:hypothetical protein